ncbi:BREX-1 system adenine-specific DNA-methyltransferase PglX [Anaerotignum sp.]|uniref:BREX-1 system adenine-specific DNA-methyltransferase PglX n=1 Tax=Anaerotignum sp. TaxID=2039241 RepID=UPI00289F20A3|nr:BREX-1 system adenine-specific DNA-methyltransferase PglX [Anaerotignum sp.]
MNKTAIKNFAVWARRKLISEITYKAGLIGISESGILSPLPISTDNIEFYDIGTGKPTELTGGEVKQRKALVKKIEEKESTSDYKTAFQFVVEEVAYTWFNRLVAIRFMEVNDYLPSRVHVLSSEMSGKAEPDMVTTPFETDMEFSSYETDRIVQLKDENKLDELFRMLFIKQCNKLNEVLPELFEKTNDYTEFLLNISFTDKDGIVSHLVNDIAEDDFKEAVEIIGWLYQYYNTEPKEQVFALLKKNVKITKEHIPAATQLFTPDWIVRYMTENSLGRLWLEGHPNDDLKADWKYYLDETEQEEVVKTELEKIRVEYKKITPEDIKLIDPCMGSGHILVYTFDVLMQIYESQGYTQRDAAQSIIENNLYGIDIDKRAYQLAYFALMMKARQYDRRFLTRGISLNLIYTSSNIDYEFANKYNSKQMLEYLQETENSSLVGSLIECSPIDYNEILQLIDSKRDVDFGIEFALTWGEKRKEIKEKIKLQYIVNQKYDVVITNPPYMGASGMNAKLSDYVKKNFPDSKSDLFAVFIEKCLQMTKKDAYTAMITQHAFMFLSSYEKLRGKLLHTDFINMAHLGARAFEEIGGEVVQTTSFVLRKSNIKDYNATFARLVDYNSQQEKENAFLAKKDLRIAQQENFSKIPGSPIAYWVSEKMLSAFKNSIMLSENANPRQGLITGSVDSFVRKWYECDLTLLNFTSTNDENDRKGTWFPYCNGGEYRRWYGNNDDVVNWENNGLLVKGFVDDKGKQRSRPQNQQYYFCEGGTWSAVTSGSLSVRYFPNGHLFSNAGMAIYSKHETLISLIAFLNSKLAKLYLSIFNEGLNYNQGDIAKLPIIVQSNDYIKNICEQNISLSKNDWDSFETSWDFEKHPLVQLCHGATADDGHEIACIEDAYNEWEFDCNERFNQLKANEEELNRIFIDIYGLQDELTPEVEDKDVTVRKADLTRDIKSFVSYAVGCMFGRYSLDVDGLAYAGGGWDDSKYTTFIPDVDNCIPITDEEYFGDDIVGLFVAFVKKVYGTETLEENLDFIAKALGNKGNTSRDMIRNYFIKDFYKDHVKTYQKRPIYWLYDSGKQDGFKALVYMHRYNADTTGLVRVDYLHKMQKTYMNEIDRMQDEIENGKTSADILKAEKRKEKLVKQLKETKEYDEKIAHLALSRIAIDLDDGVKVNYEKVQTGQDGKKLDILGKI